MWAGVQSSTDIVNHMGLLLIPPPTQPPPPPIPIPPPYLSIQSADINTDVYSFTASEASACKETSDGSEGTGKDTADQIVVTPCSPFVCCRFLSASRYVCLERKKMEGCSTNKCEGVSEERRESTAWMSVK